MNRNALYSRPHIRNLLLLLGTVTAVYAVTLGYGFVWDDHALVQARAVYRSFDLRAMFHALGNGVEYLPLRDISYAIDYRLWGEHSPAGFHASNLLLHLLVTCSVYAVSVETFRQLYPAGQPEMRRRSALLTTLLYALHPLQAQAVSFVTCRNVLLSGLFFYAACLLYLRSWRDDTRFSLPCYSGALLCCLLALMSKATVIVLPLLLCVIEWPRASGFGKKMARVVPFFLLASVFYVLFRTVAFTSGIARESIQLSWGEKVAVAGQIPWFYLRKLLMPVGFAAEYEDLFSRDCTDWLVVAALGGLVALCLVAWKRRVAQPALMFGLLWFLITLLPVLNFFATNPIVADRYAYLPGYGFCLMVGALIMRSGNRSKVTIYLPWLAVAVVALITARTVKMWQSDVTLWEANIKAAPGASKGYTNLGWSYFHKKEYEQAFAVFRQEQLLNPQSLNYDLARGYREFLNGNHQAAIRYFQLALEKKEGALYPLYLLARSYLGIGDTEHAANTLRRILQSSEIDFSGYRPKAQALLEQLQREAK
jgi:hypothetical protein